MTEKWQDQTRKRQKDDTKMTEKWQSQMTGQKKMTESNDKQDDNKNDKIIFMYPSVWLQVLRKPITWYYMIVSNDIFLVEVS